MQSRCSGMNVRILPKPFLPYTDLFLTANKYKLDIEILENSKQMPGAKISMVTAEILGMSLLKNGKFEVGQGDAKIGDLSNGFALNGEDTMILTLNDNIQTRMPSDVFEKLKPIIGKKLALLAAALKKAKLSPTL